MTIVRWIFAVLIVGLVGMAAMKGLRPRPTPPTKVHTATAARTTITHTVSGAGKLEPLRKVNVSANITGTLLDLNVGIGSKVKKDDILGHIDASRYTAQMSAQKAQVSAALSDVQRERANLAKLRADAERLEKLVDKGAANVSDLEQAHAAVRAAEASVAAAESRVQIASGGVAEAQKTLDWATLRAPVDGTVLAVNHRVGERLRGSDFAEDVILVLGSVSEMEVRIEIGEHDVVHIKPDQKATVDIDAIPDHPIRGHVIDNGRDAIVKNAGTDSEVTTFPVWIALDDPPPEALSGMSAQVSIATESHDNVVSVPIQAVTVRAAEGTPKTDSKSETGPQVASPQPHGNKLEKVVFVVKQDGTLEKRKIVVGLTSESLIEIVSGLDANDVVVDGPYRTLARQLSDGDAVEVEKDDEGKGPAARKP